MTRTHLRRLLGAALAASLMLASAGVTAAAKPAATYVLDTYSCDVSDFDGNPVPSNVVPRGSRIILFQGWFAATRGQIVSFANNVTWVLDVNGTSVDLVPLLTQPIELGPFWAILWSYEAGILDRGETIHTRYDVVMQAASYDGFAHYPVGSLYSPGIDCTVTAS